MVNIEDEDLLEVVKRHCDSLGELVKRIEDLAREKYLTLKDESWGDVWTNASMLSAGIGGLPQYLEIVDYAKKNPDEVARIRAEAQSVNWEEFMIARLTNTPPDPGLSLQPAPEIELMHKLQKERNHG